MIVCRVECFFKSCQPIGIHANRTITTESEHLENAVIAKLVLYTKIWMNKFWMIHSVLAKGTHEGNWQLSRHCRWMAIIYYCIDMKYMKIASLSCIQQIKTFKTIVSVFKFFHCYKVVHSTNYVTMIGWLSELLVLRCYTVGFQDSPHFFISSEVKP